MYCLPCPLAPLFIVITLSAITLELQKYRYEYM